jgi:hypothetical protein
MVTGKGLGYLLLAGVFMLGIAAGGGIALAFTHGSNTAMIREGTGFERHRLRALSRKLDLSGEQEERIGGILAKDREDSRTLSHDMVERCGQPLRDRKAQTDSEIRVVLHADQQRKFDRLVEERKHHAWVGRGR